LTQQKQRVTFSKRKMISVSRHSLREVELTKLDQKVSDQVKKDLGLQKTVSRVPTGGTPPFSLWSATVAVFLYGAPAVLALSEQLLDAANAKSWTFILFLFSKNKK
jgi:hypothetical protein